TLLDKPGEELRLNESEHRRIIRQCRRSSRARRSDDWRWDEESNVALSGRGPSTLHKSDGLSPRSASTHSWVASLLTLRRETMRHEFRVQAIGNNRAVFRSEVLRLERCREHDRNRICS